MRNILVPYTPGMYWNGNKQIGAQCTTTWRDGKIEVLRRGTGFFTPPERKVPFSNGLTAGVHCRRLFYFILGV